MKTIVSFIIGFVLSLLLIATSYFYMISNTIIITEDMSNKQLYCQIIIFEDKVPEDKVNIAMKEKY